MDAKNKLLDKAREHCSRPSDKALAERIDVSAQLVSHWRKGRFPMPDERIAQLAQIAGLDPAEWLVMIHVEQSTGPTHRAWEKLAQRLGLAASLSLMLAALPHRAGAEPRPALTSQNAAHTAYYVIRDRRFRAADGERTVRTA